MEITPVTVGDPIPAPLRGVTPPHVPTTSRSLSALPTDSQPGDSIPTEPALPVVTTDGDGYVTILPDTNSEANVDSSSNEPPTLSTIEPLHMVTEDQSLAPPELMPISITPVDDSNMIGYSEQTEYLEEPPETVTTSSDIPDITNKSGPRMTSSPKHVGASVYYEVLTPEGDDMVHISHRDIMSRSCSVSIQNLSENDIKELQEINKGHTPETESTSDNLSSSEQKTTSDTDWVPSPKKRVTPSNRPHKQPSRARLAAQKIINHNRSHPIRKRQTPVYPITRSKKHVIDAQPDPLPEDDSDETVIYEPPADIPSKPSKPAKLVRGKAIFTICTIGIKLAKDAEIIKSAWKRLFICFLCGHKAGSTKDLNHHFKNTHDVLKCMDCNKEYFSPLSLKKHQ